jgi:hypothetical protein
MFIFSRGSLADAVPAEVDDCDRLGDTATKTRNIKTEICRNERNDAMRKTEMLLIQCVNAEIAALTIEARTVRIRVSSSWNQVRRMVAGSRIGGGTLAYGLSVAGRCTVM